MKNNIDKMISDHKQMQEWHETMAKSAAEMMKDHIKAANWHVSQADLIKGMTEVPLDPEKKQTTIPTGGSASTPNNGKGMSAPEKQVPLDPETVKKSDLVSILKSHEETHGSFDMDVEDIANFLLNN